MNALPKRRETHTVALALSPETWALLRRLALAEQVDVDHVVSELARGALADLAHDVDVWEPHYMHVGE